MLYFGCGSVKVVIDSQLIAKLRKGLTQQTVIIQRTYQVLHDITFTVCQHSHCHLFQKLVIERLTLSHHALFAIAFILLALTTIIDRKVLIITPDRLQSLIKGRLAFFLFKIGIF